MPAWYLQIRGGVALVQQMLGVAVLGYRCHRRPQFLLRLLGGGLLGFGFCTWFSSAFFLPDNSLAGVLSQVVTSLVIYAVLFGLMCLCLQENLWRLLFFIAGGIIVFYIGGSLKTLWRLLAPLERLSSAGAGILLVDLLSYGVVDVLVLLLFRSFTRREFHFESREKVLFSVLFSVFYIMHSWLVQNYTAREASVVLVESVYDILLCVAALMIMFGVMEKRVLLSRVSLLNELVHQQKRQFIASKESSQLINEKYHDLKKMIASLEGAIPRQELQRLREQLDQYDLHIDSGNSVLDILLTEKLYACSKQHVRLTCNMGTADFSAIEELDLYTLFQNILDNAIAAVSALPEGEERFIMLNAAQRGNILTIHCENACAQPVRFAEGLPQTAGDPTRHGFGVKSMLRIAQKYHGTLEARQNGHTFVLDVLLIT